MVLSFQLRFQPWIYFTAHHVLHLQSISFDLTSLIDLCTFFCFISLPRHRKKTTPGYLQHLATKGVKTFGV
jgi:hypothetical protein